MKRWNNKLGEFLESPLDIEFFLDEIVNVCKKHGMSISHEDGHGAFKIEELNEGNIEWIRAASDDRGE